MLGPQRQSQSLRVGLYCGIGEAKAEADNSESRNGAVLRQWKQKRKRKYVYLRVFFQQISLLCKTFKLFLKFTEE